MSGWVDVSSLPKYYYYNNIEYSINSQVSLLMRNIKGNDSVVAKCEEWRAIIIAYEMNQGIPYRQVSHTEVEKGRLILWVKEIPMR